MQPTRHPAAAARPLALAAVVVTATAIILLPRLGRATHEVSFTVPTARNLVPGLHVRAAGRPVGKIKDITTTDGGRAARIRVEISDEKVWPLPRDTHLTLRYGGTIAYIARYIDLRRGSDPGPPIADGGTLAARNVTVPVEVDDVVNTFDRGTQRDLRSSLDAAGPALGHAGRHVHRALAVTPPALGEASGLFEDVGAHPAALRDLVDYTSRVVRSAEAADPKLGPLLTGTAATLDAIAGRSTQVEQTLRQLPATLQVARRTLRRANPTLRSVDALTTRLAPGVRSIIGVTPELDRTLTTLTEVGPDAAATLATARRAAPGVTTLANRATTLMPDLRSTLTQAARQLACVRPYTPEIAGFASTWDSFAAAGDGKDRYARLFFGAYPFPNATPLTVPQAAKVYPGAFESYGFPRAPGANAGQPWYQPDCGVTAAGADPQQNPESAYAAAHPGEHPVVTTVPSSRRGR